jgi:hypothetical protein
VDGGTRVSGEPVTPTLGSLYDQYFPGQRVELLPGRERMLRPPPVPAVAPWAQNRHKPEKPAGSRRDFFASQMQNRGRRAAGWLVSKNTSRHTGTENRVPNATTWPLGTRPSVQV